MNGEQIKAYYHKRPVIIRRISLMFEDEQSLAIIVSRVFSFSYDVANISPIIVSGALFIAREEHLEAYLLHQGLGHYCNKILIHT